MARQISVSPDIHCDPKFYRLALKLGNQSAAYGALVQLWLIAQKFWFPDKLPIPEKDFKELDFGKELLETGWIEQKDTGLFASGSEKHFDWIFRRQKGGRKGGGHNKIKHLDDQKDKKQLSRSESHSTQLNPTQGESMQPTSTSTCIKRKKINKRKKSETNEKNSNSHSDSDESAHSLSDAEQSKTKTPPEEIHPLVEIWNANCGLFPRVASVNPKRKRLAAAAWRENSDPEFWIGLINHAKRSEFLTGRNDRGWVMNFDFLLRPDRRDAVLEGHYHKVGANNQPIKILSGDELPDY